LEETAALFDGEPVELVEAAGEAATHHTARYFIGRDSGEEDSGTDPSAIDHKHRHMNEHKDDVQMYEDIEMSSVSIPHLTSRGVIQEPELAVTVTRTFDSKRDSYP
jgi:hypothetical protein